MHSLYTHFTANVNSWLATWWVTIRLWSLNVVILAVNLCAGAVVMALLDQNGVHVAPFASYIVNCLAVGQVVTLTLLSASPTLQRALEAYGENLDIYG
jgi:hypothetical protein